MTTLDIRSIADEALDAFWETVASRFPEIRTGDLSIERTFALHRIAEAAIAEWIDNNITPPSEESP